MSKSRIKSLPQFGSLDELVRFFDAQDLGEYWNDMPEGHFEVDIKKRRHLLALEADLAIRLTEIAKARKISSEVLVNAWLEEKIQNQILRPKNM